MKFFLIGGFLGSGKTTAISNACAELMESGVRVAVITNDQGNDLVDTGYIQSLGIDVAEVSESCFCCNYEKFLESISALNDMEDRGVIFAESVGSCTDLVATIARPLEKSYPQFSVVISVFADASLLLSLVNGTSSFLNDNVRYLYKKQLKEADILIINKIDLLAEEEIQMLSKVINIDFQEKKILYQNSLDQLNVRQWLIMMNNFKLHTQRKSLQLDYNIYAKGEAALAWLDEELNILTVGASAYEVAIKLVTEIEDRIRTGGYLIGHLKFLINDGNTRQKISVTTVGDNRNKISSYPSVNKLSVLINARVQAEPSQLKGIISNTIEEIAVQTGSQIIVKKLSSFQPGYPNPTYRILK